MDDGSPSATTIIILLIIFIIDAVVYGFGSALHYLKAEDLEEEHNSQDDAQQTDKVMARKSRHSFLLRVLDEPAEYMTTVQLLVFGLNLLIGRVYVRDLAFVFKRFTAGFGGFSELLSQILTALVLLYLMLTFSVLLPRKLAKLAPVKWAVITAPFIRFMMIILYPFSMIIRMSAGGILYLFGVRDDKDDYDVTEQEIRSMVNEGQEQGVIQDSEANMITNIFEFSDKEVKDIMTHRNDICGIDGTTSLSDAISYMLSGNNSRFPVYLDNIDHIIGIVHIRDAVSALSDNEEAGSSQIRHVQKLMRQPMYVPETRKIESLFHSMQATKTQMAIIIDEYGQTAGLVSMEDILEEIVGNIMDEYDEDESYIIPSGKPGEFIALGRTPLETLEKRFDLDLEEEEFETLNGLMISRMDRIPEEGEKFEVTIGGYDFRIMSVKNHMITDVAIRKVAAAPSPQDTSES
ncbi:hemolysin family protein [Butyrivibrio sp. MC2013]|uniref:hemolysin family protein n=1 Tax=Butyrivibrio sp. MC2013 TaxID=1280686 RepID=UPI0003F4B87E|nr:hemolysin family protein [Butyrivibrio sp. MC2013]